MANRRAVREESWSSLHRSEASSEFSNEYDLTDEHSDEELLDDSPTRSPSLLTVGDVHRALHPLQATADRVGRQVEQFAEQLDRLDVRKKTKRHEDCRDVLPLVQRFERIAADTVKRLKKIHEPERQEKSKKTLKHRLRNSSGKLTPISIHEDDDEKLSRQTTVEDLHRWELERQTWDLLGNILQVDYPTHESVHTSSKDVTNLLRPTRDSTVHRYSSEHAVWSRFLAEDDHAWKKHVIVEWLKRSADRSGDDVDFVVDQLESSAERGSGLWAHGWLYSKEVIKGQKRLRSWPQALDPNSPGIDSAMINSDGTTGVITQLDPDAVTRQGRNLEKQDMSFERATWLVCWDMVRRGRSWDSIREWCQDRVELWRAASMHGDLRNTSGQGSNDGISLATAWQSRALWRRMCAASAENGGLDEYESAVYGVLSGYLPSVEKVGRTCDDCLFAHCNAALLDRFELYIRRLFPERIPRSLETRKISDVSMVGGSAPLSLSDLMDRRQNLDAIKEEAQSPHKMLQGSLITRDFATFIVAQGITLSASANAGKRSKIIASMSARLGDVGVTSTITPGDRDLLRILTHIIFIFQDLGVDIAVGEDRYAFENIIVAYVDYLSKAGKQHLLPLYASRLSSTRAHECMGRQLPFITDLRERRTVMKLMEQYNMNVLRVLNMQLTAIILDTPPDFQNTAACPNLSILGQEMPNPHVRAIRNGFIGPTMTGDEQDLINGFEWYMLLDGHWQDTMDIGTVLYKHFLHTRSLAAARHLSRTVSFSTISLNKTEAILGRSIDINKTRGAGEDDLFDQSCTFRDLECLFLALDAMERWADISGSARAQMDPRHARAWKSSMQNAHNEVESAVEPLLQGWLQQPRGDVEAHELEQIRVACLPEIVLAYIGILNFDGFVLSREILLKCMNLAADIAKEDSDLASCFTEAGRMSELVDTLARTSQNILRAEESGAKSGKYRKVRNGETMALWTVKGAVN